MFLGLIYYTYQRQNYKKSQNNKKYLIVKLQIISDIMVLFGVLYNKKKMHHRCTFTIELSGITRFYYIYIVNMK